MKLPIDTSGMTLLCATPPEPVIDFDTRRPRADENGEPIYQLQVVALAEGGADVLQVKVSGQPKGITQGAPVKVTGLVATPWSMNDRSGVSFRAAKIEPVAAAASSSSSRQAS